MKIIERIFFQNSVYYLLANKYSSVKYILYDFDKKNIVSTTFIGYNLSKELSYNSKYDGMLAVSNRK